MTSFLYNSLGTIRVGYQLAVDKDSAAFKGSLKYKIEIVKLSNTGGILQVVVQTTWTSVVVVIPDLHSGSARYFQHKVMRLCKVAEK